MKWNILSVYELERFSVAALIETRTSGEVVWILSALEKIDVSVEKRSEWENCKL